MSEMSENISLYNVTLKDGIIHKCKTVAERYLRPNWTKWFENIWSIYNYDGAPSSVIHRSLKNSITILENDGIITGVPDPANPYHWKNGVKGDTKSRFTYSDDLPVLPEPERKSIFLYHLKDYLALTIQFPDAYWVTNCNHDLLIKHVTLGSKMLRVTNSDYDITDEEESESDDDDDDEEESDDEDEESEHDEDDTGTYFNHPIKGRMKVTTFDDCMEIFGIVRMNGDYVHAKYWKTLAFQMDDAPVWLEDIGEYVYF